MKSTDLGATLNAAGREAQSDELADGRQSLLTGEKSRNREFAVGRCSFPRSWFAKVHTLGHRPMVTKKMSHVGDAA